MDIKKLKIKIDEVHKNLKKETDFLNNIYISNLIQ